MSTDTDLLDRRVAELEEHARRIIPAREGTDGWVNFIESRLMEEQASSRELLTYAFAQFQRDLLAEVKAMLDQAMAQRVRGTFDPKEKYVSNDVVACNGASFVARRDNPGICPGPGWQMIAAQGRRGIAGERGPPEKDAPRIDRWIVDRAALTVTPVYSDGIFGPALELRELLAPEDNAAR